MNENEIKGLVVHHRPISEVALKRLLLIFDKIYFLDPIENQYYIPPSMAKFTYGQMKFELMGYGNLYNGPTFEKEESNLIDKFSKGLDTKIIDIIHRSRLEKFYRKKWLPLRLAYDFDTANIDLLKIAKTLVIEEKNPSLLSGVSRGLFISPNNVKIYPDIPEAIPLYEGADDHTYFKTVQTYSIIGKVNRALSICEEFNLTPIFIDESISKIYNEKFNIARMNQEEAVNSAFFEANNKKLLNAQYIVKRISEVTLDDDILNNIPINELIYARNNSFEDLLKIREITLKNSNTLTDRAFSNQSRKEIDDFINKKFIPEYNDYRSKFWDKMIKFLKISSPVGTTMFGTAIGLSQQLSPFEIVILSGISAAVGNIISDLGENIQKSSKSEFYNSYNYFIDLSNRTN